MIIPSSVNCFQKIIKAVTFLVAQMIIAIQAVFRWREKGCDQFFYLPIFSTPCMCHLLYLMFRCDGDVMESLDFRGVFGASKHTPSRTDCQFWTSQCLRTIPFSPKQSLYTQGQGCKWVILRCTSNSLQFKILY